MTPLKSLGIFLVVLCALSVLLFIIYYSCVKDQLLFTASNAVDKTWLPHLFLTHDKIHGILFANKSDMSKIIETTDTKRLYHNFIRSTMSIPDLTRPVNLSKYDLNLMKKGRHIVAAYSLYYGTSPANEISNHRELVCMALSPTDDPVAVLRKRRKILSRSHLGLTLDLVDTYIAIQSSATSSRAFPDFIRRRTPPRTMREVVKLRMYVVRKLSGRRNGFFIESGAYDGETMSNTLYLEMALNWTGLLIEPDPLSYRKILTKNRRAVVFNGCLSPAPYSEQISFLAAWMGGGIVDYLPANQLEKEKQRGKFHEIRCFPLSDLLASLGVTHVDYWNLDIEGAEPGVLANFNWNHTTVDVVGIEPHTSADIPAIRRIMTEKGMYKEFVSATKPYQDMMFERI